MKALHALPQIPRLPAGADPGSIRCASLSLRVRHKDIILCLPPVIEAPDGAGDTIAEVTESCLRVRENGRSSND